MAATTEQKQQPPVEKNAATTKAAEEPAATATTNGTATEATAAVGPVEDNKVFVGNLPFKISQESLIKFFESAGKVTEATIIKHGRRSLGYGFVAFETAAEAEAARTKLNKKELEGREINVEVAKPKTPKAEKRKASAEKDEKPIGAEQKPKPRRRSFRKPRRNKKKAKAAGAAAAAKTNGTTTSAEEKPADAASAAATATETTAATAAEEPKKTTSDEEQPKQQQKSKPRRKKNKRPGKRIPRRRRRRPARIDDGSAEPSKTTLFVANLPYATTDETLAEVFKDYKVKSALVARMRNGRSKGYGFVDMESEEEQKRALENVKDVVLEGRAIYLKVALSERPVKQEKEEPAADDAEKKENEEPAKKEEGKKEEENGKKEEVKKDEETTKKE